MCIYVAIFRNVRRRQKTVDRLLLANFGAPIYVNVVSVQRERLPKIAPPKEVQIRDAVWDDEMKNYVSEKRFQKIIFVKKCS